MKNRPKSVQEKTTIKQGQEKVRLKQIKFQVSEENASHFLNYYC